MSRSPIFLGDLADALRVLDPQDEESEARIAELLQLQPPRATAALDDESAVQPPPQDDAGQSRAAAASSEPPRAATLFYPSEVESMMPESTELPSVALVREDTPVLSFAGSEASEARMMLEPLLRPASSRAILSAAVSTKLAIGIDVPRTVEALARREAMEHLPLRRVRSVRRGVQLLLDKSAGMMPFLRDQAEIIRSLERVVGRQMVNVSAFIGVPQRGLLRGLSAEPGSYRTPVTGTPIVVLTDLGIARPRTSERPSTMKEWLEFASMAKKANCPLIAFVPYESKRWPDALRRAMTIVTWDRSLTAGRAAKRTRSRT
jgi:hypothetical protein